MLRFLMFNRRRHLADAKIPFHRNEDGALSIFSLFLFVLIMLMAGMAVDVMRHEQHRTKAQTTLDSAIVAATSIDQTRAPELVVQDYFNKAGLDPASVSVAANDDMIEGNSNVTGRTVAIEFDYETKPMFMQLMGVNTLDGKVRGKAQEGSSLLEIVLVLDMSESMNENGRLPKLKTAAKEFVTSVLSTNEAENVAFSIVPYNHQVYASDALLDHMKANDMVSDWVKTFDGPFRNGEIESLAYTNPDSRCANFWGDDWTTRSLMPRDNKMELSGVFVDDKFSHTLNGETNQPFEKPHDFSYWCNDVNSQVLLFENNEAHLHAYIDNIFANEGTSIDIGMKWGIGLLDPSMQPVISSMVAAGELPTSVHGHPADYSQNDVQKFVILMSDGVNDTSMTLNWQLKGARSRVWYSDDRAAGNPFMGYLVEMPENDPSEQWYAPGSPDTQDDDVFISNDALPGDQQQWSYDDVYKQFSSNDAAVYFFRHSGDVHAFVDHMDVFYESGKWGKNQDLESLCNVGKHNRDITIFTVSFEAEESGQEVLEDCATTSGHHFDVDGQAITDAFATIAVQISVLKLTE